MSRVVASTFVSLDGVMEAPEKWQLTNALFDDEMGKFVFESYAQAGSLLLGRVTYEEFAGFWPTQSEEDPFAQKLNGLPKYVVSKTMKTLDWKNSTKISGDLRQEI